MKIFAWLAAKNEFLLMTTYRKRGWNLVSLCLLSKSAAKTRTHLFQECRYMLELYQLLKSQKPSQRWPHKPTIQIANNEQTGTMTRVHKTAMLIMHFTVWRERCARCFDVSNKSKSVSELVQEVVWNMKFYDQTGSATAQREIA